MKTRSIYNKSEWVLATCRECGQDNYVEPHGLTALCNRCRVWTEHESIPYAVRRGMAGLHVDIAELRKLRPVSPLKSRQRMSLWHPALPEVDVYYVPGSHGFLIGADTSRRGWVAVA